MNQEEILNAYRAESNIYDKIVESVTTVENLYSKTKPHILSMGKLYNELLDQYSGDVETTDEALRENCLSHPDDYADALEYEKMRLTGEMDIDLDDILDDDFDLDGESVSDDEDDDIW